MHTSSFLVRGHSRSCFSIAPGADDSRPWLWIRGGWISTFPRHVVVPRFHRPRSFLFFLSPLGCLLLLAIHASYPTQSLATCGADVGLSGQTRNEDGVETSQRRRTTRTMDVHLGRSVLSHPLVLHRRLQDEPRRARHATRSKASLPWNSVVRRTHTHLPPRRPSNVPFQNHHLREPQSMSKKHDVDTRAR